MFQIIWLIFVLTHVGYVSAVFIIKCTQITTFDGSCQLPSGDVIFVTTHPCQFTTPKLSIVFVHGAVISRRNVDVKKNVTFQLNETKVVTSLEIFKGDVGEIYKLKLQMKNKDVEKDQHFEFDMNSYDCYKTSGNVVKPIAVAGQQVLGEFSTLFIPPTAHDSPVPPPNYYAIYFNPCSFPYAYRLQIFTQESGSASQLIHQFTDTMNQSLIPIPGGTAKGGLQLFTRNVFGPQYHRVNVMYVAETGSKPVPIINALYNSHLALVCPIHACQEVGGDHFRQLCETPWIDFHNVVRTGRTKITFHPYAEPQYADVDIDIEQDSELIFREPLHLEAVREDSWTEKGVTAVLHLGYPPYERKDTPWDGFIPLDLGRISLYVKKHGGAQNRYRVLIMRHYPTMKDVAPMFSTYFDYVPHEKKANNKRAIIIGLVCAFVGFVGLVFFVVYMRRRARRARMNGHQQDVGLPHQIQLDDGGFYQDDE